MIFLSFGSNLANRYGGRRLIILRALEKLESKGVRIVKSSPFYETSMSSSRHDPLFVNMMARIETEQTVQELFKTCMDVEYELGRTRVVNKGPRIIDVDLIAYHDEVIKTKDLTLPHPYLKERAYLLIPLYDIASSWIDPVSKKSIQEMMERLPSGQFVQKM